MLNKLRQSYWLRSGSLTLLNRLSITFFGLLNFILLVRILSQDDFGTWVLFLSITTLIESVRTTFMYNPLLRFMNSEDASQRKHIVSASLVLNLFVAALSSLLVVGLAFTINYFIEAPQLPQMLMVSIVAIFGFTFAAHFNFLQQSNLKFAGTAISTFVQKFILFSIIMYAFLTGYELGVVELATVYSLCFIVGALMSYWFAREENVFTFSFDSSWIPKLFHYGKYSIGTGLSSMLNKTSKEWLLGGMIGTSAVAVFAPAGRISNLFQIPLGAIASVFFPEMVNRVKRDGYTAAKYLYERSVAVILLFVVPGVTVIFLLAEPLVLLIAGKDYPMSVPVLQVMILVGLFEPFQRQFGVTLDAIGKANINFYVVIVSSITGVIINYLAIGWFGIIGAAYGILISYVLMAAVVQYILYKQIGVSTLNIFKYSVDIIIQSYFLCVNAGIKYFKNG